MSWSRALASESFRPHELVDRRERARRKSGATSTLDANEDASKPVEEYCHTKSRDITKRKKKKKRTNSNEPSRVLSIKYTSGSRTSYTYASLLTLLLFP
jgi:long-subunit acyl-CoA synthetase (AMP-forming)